MKMNNKTLASFGLIATLLFAGACASDTTETKPNSKLSLLSNGPDLPEECTPCWDEFQECFADGSDLEICGDAIVACTDACQAPPPPPECLHCSAGFEACAQAVENGGDSAGDCAAGFEGCLLACESDCSFSDQGCDPGDPGDPGDPNQPEPPINEEDCERVFNECFDDLWQTQDDNAEDSAQICDQILQECYADCPPHDGEPQPEPGFDCEQALNECTGGNGQEPSDENNINCEEVFNYCLNQPDQPQDGQEEPNGGGEPDQPGW